MDKVKIALALLKKHHFWVMTGMVILLSFVGWFVATSQLWKDYQTNKATIETKFKALAKINSEERENEKWIEGIEAETQRLKVKVRTAWDQVYTEQKTNVLTWPEVGGPRSRNKERLENLPPNAEIPPVIRRAYLNYIKNEFPRLLKIVDARDEHKEKDKKGANEEAETPHKVIWNEANQSAIFEKLNLEKVPDSQKVRDLQEDLWVYQALLKIVANLNEFSTGNYNAKVKEIQGLLIGGEAASEFQSGMAEGRLEQESSYSGTKSAGPPPSGSGGAATSGRYVNDKGLPLTETDVAPPEFKRMPVVMWLVMDQRDVLRLLVECANSPLPVEVRHLHIHTRKGVPNPGAQKGNAEKELNSYDMLVEVAGLIYIFNPPDPTKLGEVLAAATPGAPAAEPAPANPGGGGGAPAVPANPAAGEPGPADGGKAVAEPGAGATKPDAAAAPEEEMEKTDGVKDQ